MLRVSFTALLILTPSFILSCGDNQTAPSKSARSVEPEEGFESADAVDQEMAGVNPVLLDPSLATERAPDVFQVNFETTEGPFVVEVIRDWSPKGADRFYNLVKAGFFENIAFFRVIDGFVAQFGISGNPAINSRWQEAVIVDDPVKASNTRGTIVFATAGPDTRTTQLFINLADNSRSLDSRGFSPFGRVIEGMSVVDSLYSAYGEGAPFGNGPSQAEIQRQGNAYLEREFPELDYVTTAILTEAN